MEQILEQPDKRGRDFVVYLGIKASDHEDQLDPHGPSHVHNRGTIWTWRRRTEDRVRAGHWTVAAFIAV